MEEETVSKYSRVPNTKIPYPPPPHFRRRFSSGSTSTVATIDHTKSNSSLKRKSEASRSFEERQLEESAVSKRRITSIHEDDDRMMGGEHEHERDHVEKRDTASPTPQQQMDSNQERDGVEGARDVDGSDKRSMEVIDITDNVPSSSVPSSSDKNKIISDDNDKIHREVKRVGSSELASAMALASLAYGKTDSKPKSSTPPTTTSVSAPTSSIHRLKQATMPPLSAFASPQQAQDYLLSRTMSTASSAASFGYPTMNEMRLAHHPLYNHQRFNMNVPPEVFLANSQLSRPGSFGQPGAGVAPKKKQWVCDYCNEASFDDYDEACRHEATCSFNKNAKATNSITATTSNICKPVSSRSSTMDEDDRKMDNMSRMKKYQRRTMFEMGPIATRPDPDKAQREKNIYFQGSIPLAVPATDSDWLSETNCYVRRECVEAFSAKEADIMVSSKRGRISLYQVGIRCKFCANEDNSNKASGAVSFPVSVSGIYESVKRWKSVHLPECKCIPAHVKEQIKSLEKTACVPTTRQYWIDSAKAIGIDDTQDGLRFVTDPNKANQSDSQNSMVRTRFAPNASKDQNEEGAAKTKEKKEEYIVFPEDKPTITPYVYCLMRQVQPCIFSEADRFLSRSKSKVGFAGFECRHCSGHAGLGRYFPSNPKALSTNSTSQNIYSHVQKCRKCPQEVKDELKTLKFEKPTWLRRTCGWRQAFFEKLWYRLHGEEGYDGLPYYE